MLSIDQTKFITQYKKTLSVIQSVWWKIIIVTLTCLIVLYITKNNNQTATTFENAQQQTQINILKKSIEKYTDTPSIPDGEVYIYNGSLITWEDSLQSNNNLIQYKGFILPKNSAIFSLSSIKNKNYFQNTTYNIEDLRLQIMWLINGSTTNTIQQKFNAIQVPDNNIYALFSLQCLDKAIRSPLCQRYIRIFLDNFYVFNIITVDQDIKNIAEKLRKEKDKRLFCENILYYTQYTENFSDNIESSLNICDANAKEKYQKLKNFSHINNEINNNIYQNNIYTDTWLNTYKLISLTQNIFNDTQSDNLNTRRMEWYISHLQSLMRKPNIDSVYWDMTYRFINKYLVPYIQQNSIISQKYPGLTNQLLWLNKPSILLQHSGLQNLIYNTGLIQAIQDSAPINNTQAIDSLVQWLNMLPYLTITKQSVNENTIDIQWFLTITHPIQWNITTDFSSTLIASNNRLLVDEIKLNEYSLFSDVLKTFIQSRSTTLPALYNYINENIALYSRQSWWEICEQIQSITIFDINICNTTIIQWTMRQTPQDIEYKIQIQWNTIQSIQTSDEKLTQYLNQEYKDIISDPIRLPWLIKEILLSQIQETEKTQTQTQENTDIVRIAEKFETFFKVKPSDIVLFQDTYYIEFSANSITFILAYNEQENTTGPLYFRDVFVNWSPLHLNNRSIVLNQENIQTINTFMKNPLKYIETNDPFIYESYLQFK